MTALPTDPEEERRPALVAKTIEKVLTALAKGQTIGYQGSPFNPLASPEPASGQTGEATSGETGEGARQTATMQDGASLSSEGIPEDSEIKERPPRTIADIRHLI